jgi:eukaryotic-like serine/threonine-protein kinase
MTSIPRQQQLMSTMADPADASEEVFARVSVTDVVGTLIEKDLLSGTVLIGSSTGCDLRLKSPDIGANHCIIFRNGKGLMLRDLGTVAGTRLNGHKVREVPLNNGDQLQLGRHVLTISTNLPQHTFAGIAVDEFLIDQLLGSGGMSWVFGGRNSRTGQFVALKVLPTWHTERMWLQFRLEARAACLVQHANLIRTEKTVQHGETWYMVMEYFESISVQELVEQQGPIPWKQACQLAFQAAMGLQSLHEANLVHRDLKPANLMVSRDATLKIIDFGLVLDPTDTTQIELAKAYHGHILGTADYIAPEQIEDSNAVDGRADLYSLGAAIFFMLTGQLLYPGTSVREKLQAQKTVPSPAIELLLPELPFEVVQVVERLLAKKPSDRIQSAVELQGILKPFCERKTLSVRFPDLLKARWKDAEQRLRKVQLKAAQRATGRNGSTASSQETLATAGPGDSIGSDLSIEPAKSLAASPPLSSEEWLETRIFDHLSKSAPTIGLNR